jgi:hypothetical protein
LLQGATLAIRLAFVTKVLTSMNEESVVFVEELWVRGQAGLEELADLVVGLVTASHAMTLKDAARVGIDDKDGMVAGVEENRVGSFRPNPID